MTDGVGQSHRGIRFVGTVFVGLVILASAGPFKDSNGVQRVGSRTAVDLSAFPNPESAGFAPTMLNSTENDSTRSLAEYYARRAYPGAPPIIPHELNDPSAYGGRACNRCHERSRYISRFGAYTPLTPHPELLSCRSCHMLPVDDGLFVGSVWEKPAPPELPEDDLPDIPPDIPHSLQMRTKCLSCHSGPGSVPEIRTPHPEEEDCLACHVPIVDEEG